MTAAARMMKRAGVGPAGPLVSGISVDAGSRRRRRYGKERGDGRC